MICDDNKTELKDLLHKINQYYNSQSIQVQIKTYENSKTACFDLEDKAAADVYILDIDMPDINGIDLGKRALDLHPYATLFFYTSHIEYASAGYRAEARRYLLKGEPEKHLYEALDYAYKNYKKTADQWIRLHSYRDIQIIKISEIIYLERELRSIKIRTRSSTIYSNESLQKICQMINDPAFIYISRGCVVNISFIEKTEENIIYINNGERFTISRSRVLNVKRSIMEYWNYKG